LGPMRARDGNVHRGRPKLGLLPMISHLGAMISVVNGLLLARRLQGRALGVGVASIGDGATSTGAFHEALNQAAVEQLPLVLVVANNQYAYSTPTSRQFACKDLADKAAGYGVAVHSADGTDLRACLGTLREAVTLAREGHGPRLVVSALLRLCGHGEHDDAAYIDPALRASALGRDCLKTAEEMLLAACWATAAEIDHWRQEASTRVDEALAVAQRDPEPDAFAEDWCAIATRRLAEAVPGPASA
jgi:acetoin:2,6-dichlorophenolindophenol oxidoreductase subunit alpha